MKVSILVLLAVMLAGCSTQPAKLVSQPNQIKSVTAPPVSLTVSNYTAIYNSIEYYFDPTITVHNGEAVYALYLINSSKKREYKYIPKKDVKEPLILHQN